MENAVWLLPGELPFDTNAVSVEGEGTAAPSTDTGANAGTANGTANSTTSANNTGFLPRTRVVTFTLELVMPYFEMNETDRERLRVGIAKNVARNLSLAIERVTVEIQPLKMRRHVLANEVSVTVTIVWPEGTEEVQIDRDVQVSCCNCASCKGVTSVWAKVPDCWTVTTLYEMYRMQPLELR